MSWLLGCVFMFIATAQAADLKIKPLFDARSRQPNALIPFRVSGETFKNGVISKLKVTDPKGDCKIAQDPYMNDIILLKCKSETSASLELTVATPGEDINVEYGPVGIAYPTAVTKPIDPTDSGELDFRRGKSRFSSYCIGCHNPPKTKINADVTRIQNAIKGRPEMNGSMKNAGGVDLTGLKIADIKLIELFLKTPEK